jgi:hypothetical protein
MADELKVLNNTDDKPAARSCGGCTVCCDVLPNPPHRDWDEGCKYSDPGGAGCTVYPIRVQMVDRACKDYNCAWILGMGEEGDRPDLSGVIVDYRESAKDGVFKWFGLCFREGADRDVLGRICDDLKQTVYHLTRDLELIETWQSSQ